MVKISILINISLLCWYKNIFLQGLFFSITLFTTGLFGLLINKQSFLINMMALEIMFLGLVLNFVFLANILRNPTYEIIALILITLAAIESAIGLGIIITLDFFNHTLNIHIFSKVTY